MQGSWVRGVSGEIIRVFLVALQTMRDQKIGLLAIVPVLAAPVSPIILRFTNSSHTGNRFVALQTVMPSATRVRSPSPSTASKKPRLDSKTGAGLTAGPAISLPAETTVSDLAEQYQTSAPYKHISVASLFDDDVLQGVVSESRTYGTRHEEGSLPGWGWEHKETDIYKVRVYLWRQCRC